MQILEKLKPNEWLQCVAFPTEMLSRIENEHDLLNRIIFSDETTFHVSNKVNKHSWRISDSENPHVVQEVERNSPKINVWCALSYDTVIEQFLFVRLM
ncbi:hypothetical protein AVEN_157270-1 [Araneus ventricosus]|uniref:Tc1-like transposase DDE domain-containing protein n=1 Tax=Araneus ventricosus TaxID=182803 RepID=A0A4Y2ML61_ARAVE|nr:hypothetical protein AVEN_157270-1 [Araneus ventricosus]